MQVPAMPENMPQKVRESRKIWGLLLTVLALIGVLVLYIIGSVVAYLLFDYEIPWNPFNDVLYLIFGTGGTHQVSQGASDVMKWRSRQEDPLYASDFRGSSDNPPIFRQE